MDTRSTSVHMGRDDIYLVLLIQVMVVTDHYFVCVRALSRCRFLVAQPKTTKDVELLTSVVQFLTTLLTVKVQSTCGGAVAHCPVNTRQLVWLVEVTCHEGAMCLQLLQSSPQEKQSSVHQRYSM